MWDACSQDLLLPGVPAQTAADVGEDEGWLNLFDQCGAGHTEEYRSPWFWAHVDWSHLDLSLVPFLEGYPTDVWGSGSFPIVRRHCKTSHSQASRRDRLVRFRSKTIPR